MRGLHAIVLAAGRGERFGGGKLMAPWRGGVLLDGALAAAAAAPVETVRVVVGADLSVARQLEALGIPQVPAPNAAEGLSASLRAGIGSLPGDAVGALIFLGDMPIVPHVVLAPLAAALLDAPAAVPVFRGRQGHPVALAASQFAAAAALRGDRGARAVLDALGAAVARIEAPDDGVLIDVDAPSDLRRLPR